MTCFRTFCLLVACTLLSTPGLADDAKAAQKKREDAFTKAMANCVLVGSFTVDGKSDGPPKEERYEIESVTKSSERFWTFLTRIKYGKTDVKLPITVPVVWAEETPMVSLTDMSIPGLGDAFSAKVIFDGDRYAGTWQHGKVGGHMFGRIEKSKPKSDAKK